ncbi:MAG: ankyrin repeat domain-containing protein [Pirellulaceae bacterium]
MHREIASASLIGLALLCVVGCTDNGLVETQKRKIDRMSSARSGHSDPDEALVREISLSRQSLGQFVAAFRNRSRAQTDFLVVTLEDSGDCYLPVGVLVDSVSNDSVSGLRVENTLTPHPSGKMHCRMADVVDWRYVDAYEMVGGALYRELYRRPDEHDLVLTKIRDKQRFLIEREGSREAIEDRNLAVFRDIANGRCDNLKTLNAEALSIDGIKAPMPQLTFDVGRRVVVHPVTIPEYAAMYGNRSVIDLLASRGVFSRDLGGLSPVFESSLAGNVETTGRLLELGFPADSGLEVAVKFDHAQVVRLLLDSGANPDVRGVAQRTPLFYARSTEVAQLLIDAGADIDARSDTGGTPLDAHLFHCNNAVTFDEHYPVARLLLDMGAEHREGVVQKKPAHIVEIWREQAAHGDKQAKSYLELSAITASVDFGCVLPVRSIPKSAVGE